jgi:hypothetical protein
LNGGFGHAGEFSAGLSVVFESELADHAVKFAGKGGEILEGHDALFSTLGIYDSDLRNLAG